MSLGKSIFQGMMWSALERVSIQALQFVLGVILARLLTPTEYGTVGLLIVFITLSQVFIDSGFSNALIQKKNRTEEDKSTVFWFNLVISIFFYIILYFIAPVVADFYDLDILKNLLRVMALSLIISSLSSVASTLILIDLNFKLFAKVNLISTIFSGGIAVFMAYSGFGVWALVFQTLIKTALACVLVLYLVKWKPSFIFSFESFRGLFSYGSKLLISRLMASFSSQINLLLIGKYTGTKELGYYTRGIQFSDVIYGVFSSALSSVLLPGLAPLQDKKNILVAHTRTIIKTASVITIPVFTALSIMSEPIIRLLLTDKWLMAAPIMQIFCFARLVSIMSEININLLYVVGRTDLVLKQQYFNISIRIILLLIALQFGIVYIAIAELTASTIHFFINTYYPGKMMKYGAFHQIKDISPVMFSGLLMAVVMIGTMWFVSNDIIKIMTGSLVGAASYLLMMHVIKVKEFYLIIERLRNFISTKKV